MVTEILKRYEGTLPKNVDMRNFNRLIKEVAQVAGIDKPIVTAYVEGGIKKEDITPKWQTISTHSARKAGATILRNSGVRIEDIQMLLGHASIETTMRYLYVDMDEAARRVENSSFFTDSYA